MLNIDYSNPRKFVLSTGITLIFLGALLMLGVFTLFNNDINNMVDDFQEGFYESSKNPELNKTEWEIMFNETAIEFIGSKEVYYGGFLIFSFVIIGIGLIMTAVGLFMWHLENWKE